MLSAVKSSLKHFTHISKNVIISESKRNLNTSQVLQGKRNFRKFPILNKRGSRLWKQTRAESDAPEIPPHNRGVKATGLFIPLEPKKTPRPIVPLDKPEPTKFKHIPEMVPELIVPDLTGCKFKPYVSYKVRDINQPEFTSADLFDAIYSEKIVRDFKNAKLGENYQPLEPSPQEMITPEEAIIKARQTGADIFQQDPPPIEINGKIFTKN